MIDLRQGRYGVVYADPAWTYDDKAAAGQRGAEFQYPCMTTTDIRKLAVAPVAADDALLFLWATFPKIKAALSVFPAWGFVYKTAAFVWVKRTKSGAAKIGMGNWTRSNAEVCLLGVRGKPQRQSAAVRQIIDDPDHEPEVINAVPGRHSEKPAETRGRIVELCGDLPRIELFARQRVNGWDAWGNQLPSAGNNHAY